MNSSGIQIVWRRIDHHHNWKEVLSFFVFFFVFRVRLILSTTRSGLQMSKAFRGKCSDGIVSWGGKELREGDGGRIIHKVNEQSKRNGYEHHVRKKVYGQNIDNNERRIEEFLA